MRLVHLHVVVLVMRFVNEDDTMSKDGEILDPIQSVHGFLRLSVAYASNGQSGAKAPNVTRMNLPDLKINVWTCHVSGLRIPDSDFLRQAFWD